MPRRSRPATMKPPQHATAAPKNPKASSSSRPVLASTRRPRKSDFSEDASETESTASGSDSGAAEDGSGDDSGEFESGSDDEQEHDLDAEPDAPRVAQWLDEEDLEQMADDQSESESSEEEEEVDGDRLEASLKALPFGALRKAQKALAKAQAADESADEDSSAESSSEEKSFAPSSRLDKGKEREEPREKKEVPKRKNKHAPMEMSSKRPVPRTRFVAEEKVVPRDPRFLPITGEFDPKRFHTQYGFLSEMHEEEMKTLKENLKRARKLLANSPRDLRDERAAEVERLERAVKRAESTVNRDRQERVQLEALSRAKREEREKQKEGKRAWYMKNSDKKDLLLRAKYDALAAEGGRGAVRKAIEKKQKKVSQKEKKKRPFVTGPPPRMSGDAGASRKRSRPSGEGGPRKRTKPS